MSMTACFNDILGRCPGVCVCLTICTIVGCVRYMIYPLHPLPSEVYKEMIDALLSTLRCVALPKF